MTAYDYSIYYRRFHDESDEHAAKMTRFFAQVLANALPADRAAEIVDVGCGFGFALRAARSLGYERIRGVEASPEQAQRCARAGFDVEVHEDTAAWLEARPGAFDCVLLLDVLEHIPREAELAMLRAIHRSLRPGGRLVLTTPNANSILASRWLYNDVTHHASFTEHSLHFLLANAGFARIDIDASKGLGRFPWRLWRRRHWPALRKWLVRWCWLQVFKAEIPDAEIGAVSFELNLKAVAFRQP